jgi:hypothetical protein
VLLNIEILKEYGPFNLHLSFHEDVELDDFYIYHVGGVDMRNSAKWQDVASQILKLGARDCKEGIGDCCSGGT